MSGKRCVLLQNKRDPEPGKLMALPDNFEEFLKQAGEKLNIIAKKAFTENGAIIDDLMLIKDDERVYISAGEGFWRYEEGKVRTYKIAVLGAGGVGKSCLALRYVRNSFVDVYDPTIEDAFRHQTVIDGSTCMLDILDTAGQEDMKMLRRQWVQDRDGFVLVYSMVDRRSFEEISYFINLIQTSKAGKQVPLVFCANKSDLKDTRCVSRQEGTDLAKVNHAEYIEASARLGENIIETFEALIRKWNKIDGLDPVAGSTSNSIPVTEQQKPKKKFCIIL